MATGRRPHRVRRDRHHAAHGRGHDPANGASGVSSGVSPTVTFSEAMDPASLTTSTFTLTKQGNTTGSRVVSYQSQVATLDPNASLEANTSYTAKVKGGTGGAKDVAGNVLAADVSWSFTTAEATNRPPSPVIDTPASTLTWKVGDAVAFTGHASDPEQGTLPASALSWSFSCSTAPRTAMRTRSRAGLGSPAARSAHPTTSTPSYLELELTAVDAGGLSATATLRLDPQTVALSFTTSPSGLSLVVDGISQATPFARTVIVGSTNSLSAPTPQTLNGTTYQFSSWSDGNAQTHNVVALPRRRPSPPTT